MEITVDQHIDNLQSCIITTGVSSLNYYYEHIQFEEKDSLLLYNCMSVANIRDIPQWDDYKVIIDLYDNNIKEIVFELLNHLLPFDAKLHIKAIYNTAISNDDIQQCMTLLNRLDKHKLIQLEIINKSSKSQKKRKENFLIKKLKNTFFFTGAGNTGKTSLISALSEFCKYKGHTIALIDLTENNKLTNYFTNAYSLMRVNREEGFMKERIKDSNGEIIEVYAYNYKGLTNSEEERVFCESIKKISAIYDYVFVNTDINVVNTNTKIFGLGEKVFIVQDFMLTKINNAKHILLKFNEGGINTQGSISLIYNKMIKCYFNVGFIEEKMIFLKKGNTQLIPLVDLHCETFEIPYSKKTMKAMMNHIFYNRSIIHYAAYSYRRNIEYIYKYINNMPYVEVGDLDVFAFAKNTLDNIIQHGYMQNIKKEVNKYIMYVKSYTKNISYLIHSRILEKH